ncbi:unnamed protein product [Caenorhabditis angaria]|uniref:Uncharacterized protein n=1 Tax=Caenorhabditis angaria TaxID=860376 RepID=A0A9P1ID87_9PELO|nr:unnamed protein product [Caenorhabditis angaria]
MSSPLSSGVDEQLVKDILDRLRINFGGILDKLQTPERTLEIAKLYAQFCKLEQQNSDVEDIVFKLQLDHFERAEAYKEETAERIARTDLSIARATEAGCGHMLIMMKSFLMVVIEQKTELILERKVELDGYMEKIQKNKAILKEVEEDIKLMFLSKPKPSDSADNTE